MSNNVDYSPEYSSVSQTANVVRESVYYNDIRKAVDSSDIGSFKMLLSMLTKDATEFDQFNQVSTPTTLTDKNVQNIFSSPSVPLYGQTDRQRSTHQNELISNGHFQDVRLENTLRPEALSYKNQLLEQSLIDSLDYNVKQRTVNPAIIESQEHSNSSHELKVSNHSKIVNIHSIERPNSMDIDSWFNTLTASRSLDLVG
ncbi:VC2046/SO_2500 family protein [Psychrosphaera haliotis]|uniref:VC2046/SO_2500 family protein n=1 Tax=Psychrosphaera haliotis TaxID=555083 RepID=UPI0012DA0C82